MPQNHGGNETQRSPGLCYFRHLFFRQLLLPDELYRFYKGKVTEWSIEGRSPNVLARRGWTKGTVHAGDKVTLIVYPLKNGDPGAQK